MTLYFKTCHSFEELADKIRLKFPENHKKEIYGWLFSNKIFRYNQFKKTITKADLKIKDRQELKKCLDFLENERRKHQNNVSFTPFSGMYQDIINKLRIHYEEFSNIGDKEIQLEGKI